MPDVKTALRKTIATNVAVALLPTLDLLDAVAALEERPVSAPSKRSSPKPARKAAPAQSTAAKPRHPRSWLRTRG